MNTRESDDEQYEWLLERRRDARKGSRWMQILVYGAFVVLLAVLIVDKVFAGGTVAESKSVVLQRSGTTLTTTTNPPLACPVPKTWLECAACAMQMYDEERSRRTTGYVTYKCHDDTQWKVTFNTTPFPAPEPPVVTSPPTTTALQVYTCADAGADGKILESSTVQWPNCASVSYQNPSRSLVVAVNTGTQPLYWRLASKVTTGRIWTQTGTVGAWTRVEDINWGAVTGSATLTWTKPTQNTNGSALTNLAGYRIVYGQAADSLDQVIEVPNPSMTTYIVDGLSPATWYFAIKAYNSAGVESAPSNVLGYMIK